MTERGLARSSTWEEQVFIAAELKASAGAAKKIGPI